MDKAIMAEASSDPKQHEELARPSAFMRYWLQNKKDLARIHRLLTLASDVLENFIQSYLKEEDFLSTHFKDVHEHLSRTNRSALLAMEKLGVLTTTRLDLQRLYQH